MRLSASIHQLKRNARLLSRKEKIPLHAALDRIANNEGFRNWSLLLARVSPPAGDLYRRLSPGDMVLIAARPGHGKTLTGLKLAIEAMKAGRRSIFFTLEYTTRDVADSFHALGVDPVDFGDLFALDTSDMISADHIARTMQSASRGTLAVVDYLQLLDQKRDHPTLDIQIRKLKSFAEERGLILAFISQIDRSYDPGEKPYPDMDDVRLPNALDLSLFGKRWFLNDGAIRFEQAAR